MPLKQLLPGVLAAALLNLAQPANGDYIGCGPSSDPTMCHITLINWTWDAPANQLYPNVVDQGRFVEVLDSNCNIIGTSNIRDAQVSVPLDRDIGGSVEISIDPNARGVCIGGFAYNGASRPFGSVDVLFQKCPPLGWDAWCCDTSFKCR